MNTTIKVAIGTVVGAAVGFAVGWQISYKKARMHIQEEIDSVKKAYENRKSFVVINGEKPKSTSEPVSDKKAADKDEAIKRTVDTHAVDYNRMYGSYTDLAKSYLTSTTLPAGEPTPNIYIIDECEMGDLEPDGYTTQSWVWYTDSIMATYTDDEMITDWELAIGVGWQKVFEDGEDFAYVRNKVRQCDYEIIRSGKSYTEDVLPTKPPTLEEWDEV